MSDEKKMEMLEARFLKNPKSILFARLADYYLQQNRVDEAVNLCKEGTKYHPYYITGNFILGKAYIAANEFDKAEEALKKVLSHDRQHLAAHELLAELMLKLGWENKAVVHYKEILKIDPLNGGARQTLNSLTGNEIEHEEPPPKVSDAEEDLPSSDPQTQSPSDDKPWMKKLEEAFPKHFPEESETPVVETLSAPSEEMTEEMSMESLISKTEALIDENSEPRTPAETSDGIKEIETEDLSAEDQTGQTAEEEEKNEPFFDEEDKEQNTTIEEEKSPQDEAPEAVKEEELFEKMETEPEQKEAQDEKEEVKEEAFFHPITPDSELTIAQIEQQETVKKEDLFEGISHESEPEQPLEEKEEAKEETKEEVFFHPTTPDSEQTLAQIEQQETVIEEDLVEAPLPELASEESQEKKEDSEKKEVFIETAPPETEEALKEEEKKTGEQIPEKEPEKDEEESVPSQEDEISEPETETEESGFFIEVTEPESPVKDEAEPPEPEKSETDEKITEDKQEEKEVPQTVEEKPEEKTPEPEPEISDEEPEAPKQESPPEDEKGKKNSKIMTPTLGEIYAAQGQFEKAIKVYENLIEKNPDNKHYQEKIEELKNKLKDAK